MSAATSGDDRPASLPLPGSRFAHPGYEEEIEGGRTPTDADKTAALARGARSAERARLSAFHRGSHLREYFIPKAQLQARLPVGVDGPRRHRCARMRSLQISDKGAVRGQDYPHWHRYVQECFCAARGEHG